MTDEQIIKALECCLKENECQVCPYGAVCLDNKYVSILSKDALDLINRQKVEIERLKDHNKQLRYDRKQITTKAIKEFAERLKKHCYVEPKDQRNVVAEIIIDHYVKEMTEPVKLEHDSLCETETFMGE